MKVQELMIGDWVIDGTQPAQVTGITCSGVIETTANEFSNIEVIEPIRITSDFLQRNGFHRDGCYYRLALGDGSHLLEFYMHKRRLRQFWQGVDEWNNHAKTWDTTLECQCYYVHELQHVLRLVGLSEVADNFKI